MGLWVNRLLGTASSWLYDEQEKTQLRHCSGHPGRGGLGKASILGSELKQPEGHFPSWQRKGSSGQGWQKCLKADGDEEEEREGRTRREDLGTRREGRRKDKGRSLRCPPVLELRNPRTVCP